MSIDVLPHHHWTADVARACRTWGVATHLDGTSSATREDADTPGIDLIVLDGEAVAKHLSWLHDLYHGFLLDLCRDVAGPDIVPSPDLRSGLNVNYIAGKGNRYEWHVDTNPLTGILYVTTHQLQDGGGLVFRDPWERFQPQAGVFVCFDARERTHAVLPLERDMVRIAAVMNFYDKDGYVRPADLDGYLYR
jgi:hypothetical protein